MATQCVALEQSTRESRAHEGTPEVGTVDGALHDAPKLVVLVVRTDSW